MAIVLCVVCVCKGRRWGGIGKRSETGRVKKHEIMALFLNVISGPLSLRLSLNHCSHFKEIILPLDTKLTHS